MIIQVAMLITGLYVIISGKFGLGKAVYLEGRKARTAGLILLIPVLFVFWSSVLYVISDLTGVIGQEAFDREIGGSERAVWFAAFNVALAYVNFHATSRGTKTRSGCLGPWLSITFYGAATLIMNYFRNPDFRQVMYPSGPSWALIAHIVVTILQALFRVAIWMWKKWGVFGYAASALITLVIRLIAGGPILPAFLGLSTIVVVGLLAQPKWEFFE